MTLRAIRMTEPRNHHYISQCYLKGFTLGGRKDSKLYAVNLSNGSPFHPKPKGVGAERDFNRVEGLPPGEVERALSGFESQVDAALGRIRRRRSIDDTDDWIWVLNLAALFAIRNPRWRENIRDSIDRASRMIMDLALATPERWESQVRRMRAAGVFEGELSVTYEQLKRFHEEGNYDIKVSTASHLAREFKIHDSILRTMVARRWLLCVASQETGGLITSDHPVCLMHNDGTLATFQRPVEHGLSNSTVIFPICSDLLAVGTFEGTGGVRQLSPLQVAYMNGVVAGFAERQIYARDDSFRVVIGDKLKPLSCAELCRRLADREKDADPASS